MQTIDSNAFKSVSFNLNFDESLQVLILTVDDASKEKVVFEIFNKISVPP